MTPTPGVDGLMLTAITSTVIALSEHPTEVICSDYLKRERESEG